MKVAALVHFSMPFRCAGSETVLHELMKAAVDAGHDVTVWCTHRDGETAWRGNEPVIETDGMRVVRVRNVLIGGQKMAAWAPDVVVTHHQHSVNAIKIAARIGARSVYTVHNDMDINRRPLRARPDLVIHNSDWVRDSLNSRFGSAVESLVFHPPLTPERHAVDSTGDAVTLVNLNDHKGSRLFYELAVAEPGRKFIGVVGGHGRQVIRRNLPNVTIMEHGPDMRRVWEQTRTLIMPSVYESYGLVAVEAGLNGIPTIAHPTPGLVENIGTDGLFADRDSVAEWQLQLDYLDDEHHYWLASNYAKTRADEALTATRHSLKKWVEWIG
jgi:glycosyltransferase involved in cell wall biosynthesis